MTPFCTPIAVRNATGWRSAHGGGRNRAGQLLCRRFDEPSPRIGRSRSALGGGLDHQPIVDSGSVISSKSETFRCPEQPFRAALSSKISRPEPRAVRRALLLDTTRTRAVVMLELIGALAYQEPAGSMSSSVRSPTVLPSSSKPPSKRTLNLRFPPVQGSEESTTVPLEPFVTEPDQKFPKPRRARTLVPFSNFTRSRPRRLSLNTYSVSGTRWARSRSSPDSACSER